MCGGRSADSEGQYLYEFEDRYIRHAFIVKVFSIVAAQLVVTAALVTPFIFVEPLKEFALKRSNFWIPLVIGILLLALMLVLACCEAPRLMFPLNLILLGLFTVLESALLGFTCAARYPLHILIALAFTFGLVVFLIIFALQTWCDFTACIILPLILLILLLVMGIVALFWRNNIFMISMCCLGALTFCFLLVIDVQLMLGGRHAYAIDPDDYVLAALSIYIDIVNIFRYILGIATFASN